MYSYSYSYAFVGQAPRMRISQSMHITYYVQRNIGMPKILNLGTHLMEHGVLCTYVQAFSVNTLIILSIERNIHILLLKHSFSYVWKRMHILLF